MTAIQQHLKGGSRIYAVFGDPVAQVQTPFLINPLFAEHGFDIVAVPFHVTAVQLQNAFAVFSELANVAGIGVTVPHKLAAAKQCDTLTAAAAEIGVVNSIRRNRDGTLQGGLFDGLGFVAGLGKTAAVWHVRVFFLLALAERGGQLPVPWPAKGCRISRSLRKMKLPDRRPSVS